MSKLPYTMEQKIKFLLKRGYDVKLEKLQFSEPCYHNEVHTFEREVYTVRNHLSGAEVHRPMGTLHKDDWVDRAFHTIFYQELYNLAYGAHPLS